MKTLLGYAAFAGALGLVDAKALKWSPDENEKRWAPPQETLGFMPALGMNGITGPPAPAPTSPPVPDVRRIEERAATDNTCGYINGIESNSMYCPTSQFCAINSINSHVGCCDDASSSTGCKVWTTCLASSQESLYTTDNGLTLWCGFATYPNCLTHVYSGLFSGYTLLGCGVATGKDKIIATIISTTSSSSGKSPTSPQTTTSTPSSSSPADGLGPNATNPPVPTESSKSSTPIGPIVGGVVGGVAAIALIAFGIFFLVRSNNKRKDNIAPATAGAAIPPPAPGGGQGPPPPMAQQPNYHDPSGAGFAHLDPRASIAKPPYYDQTNSPTSSPPPHSPAPMYNAQNNTPSPPPGGFAQGAYSPQGQGQGQYSPQQQQQAMYPQQGGAYAPPQQQQQHQQGYPPQQQQGYSPQQQQQQQQHQPPYGYHQQQQSPPPQFVAELPTQRGDGEVRELAG